MTDSAIYRNALLPGTELMEYRLEAVLGAGGFGLTYLAWDAHLQKRVAIKEYLPAEFALRALDGTIVPVATQRQDDYRWGLDRFLQEARTLARFSHPHIVRVNRYFEANNTAYMVMEYEEGESLNRLLKREPRPPEEKLHAILAPLLDGLRAVHEAGFLHRDIKPSNIFLREQGSPVLLDFGAARHAIGGAAAYTAVVTPGYAPIEQYSEEARQGPWSDIYAVSGVFYRAVTNENPPDAVSRLRRDRVGAALTAARDRYSVQLLSAIGWALEMEEGRRPQSVAQWQGGLAGTAEIPYRLADAGSGEGSFGRATRLMAADTASAQDREWKRRYTWGVPLALLAIIAARTFDGENGADSARREASASTQPAPLSPSPARSAPVLHREAEPGRTPIPSRETAARQRRPESAAAASGVGAADDEQALRAPARDAVLLPPLAGAAHDRPGRDRSARPGHDP